MDSLEKFIAFSAYSKACCKRIRQELEKSFRQGYLQEGEEALVNALLIGLDKIDSEYRQLLEKVCQRVPEEVIKVEKG